MEKDKLSQNSKRGQAATYLSTLEDKTMNILDKNESTEQSPNNVYFTQKIKGQRVSNGQNEFFIKWQNLLRSKWIWEPEENISPKAITEKYFKESPDKGTHCDTNVQLLQLMFNLCSVS